MPQVPHTNRSARPMGSPHLFLRSLSCCWLIAGAPMVTLGATDGNEPITANVIVSATRTPEPLESVAQSATVLSREQIERSPFSGGHQTDDLLRSVPGVQPSLLSSRYNHPTAQAISLRDSVPAEPWCCWMVCRSTMDSADGSTGGLSQTASSGSRSFPAGRRICTEPGRWAGWFSCSRSPRSEGHGSSSRARPAIMTRTRKPSRRASALIILG